MRRSPETTDLGPSWGADLALGAATVLAYAPVFSAGFIWDDDAHVTRPELQGLAGLRRIWFEPGATQQYYPVLHSAFWVEHRLWGQNPLGYHLLNVALHLAAALLFARVLWGLLDPAWPRLQRQVCAYGAAAVFALHPVGVESVAWIAEQKNTLSTVFALCAALFYLRFDRARGQPQGDMAVERDLPPTPRLRGTGRARWPTPDTAPATVWARFRSNRCCARATWSACIVP